MRGIFNLCAAGSCLFFALSGSAQAATFTVTTFDDPPPVAAPNGCNNAGSCSLREAVLAANNSNEPNTILLGEGTYHLTIPEANSPETGDLDFTTPSGSYTVTVQGAGQDKTFIDADPGLNERVLDFGGGNTTTITVSDLTIQNGNSPGSGGGMFVGGSNTTTTLTNVAFFQNKSTLTGGGLATNSGTLVTSLQNVSFISNQAVGFGGGFDHEGGNPNLIIDGGTYSDNQAGTDGGGLYLNGGGSSAITFVVQNIFVVNNFAFNGNGGGLFQGSTHPIEIDNVQVTGNSAANPGNAGSKGEGGGIYISNGASPLNGVIQNSAISGNTADGDSLFNSAGGGLWTGGGGLFKIENSSFENNQGLNGKSGGGVYVNNGGGILISGSTFAGNSAGEGGGLDINGASSSTKEITNSTISGNHADNTGGGLSVNRPDGLSLNNVTVTLNTAGVDGAGINNKNLANPLNIQNSIFSANDSAGPTDDCAGPSYHSLGFNIFASANNGGCTTDGLSPGTATNDTASDPNLGPLTNNGGTTRTHALLAGSPAIDGGNPGGCTDGSGVPLTTDQRGVARPQGPACDIGPYEVEGAATFIVTRFDDPAPVAAPNGCNTGGSCSLREAVLAANNRNAPNTILLGEGTYHLTIPEANSPETGDLDFTTPSGSYTVTVQGAGQDKTFIDADPGLNERVLDFGSANTTTITVSDLTIQNGNSPGSGGGMFVSGSNTTTTLTNVTFFQNKSTLTGGGLATNSGTLVTNLKNVSFSSNQATGFGGGFDHEGGNPTLIIDGGTYSDNQAGTDGGGLYLNGGGSSTTSFVVQNIIMSDNKALNGNGGGLFQGSTHPIEIDNVQVTGNSAANPGNAGGKGEGGGIYTSNGASSLNGVIQNSAISGNTAAGEPLSNAAGGGLFISGSALFKIENSSFENNQGLNGKFGGGVYVSSGGGILVSGSTFAGNSAGEGGGLDINGATSSVKEITNSTISGNHADNTGGGLSVNRADGLSLNNVTVTLNTAGVDGAGINNKNFADPLNIQNSIFSANDSAGQTDDCAGPSYHSLGFNIFASPNNGGCTTDGVSPGTATNDTTSDPNLGPLADNGGTTQTHALLAGSPAIDGGNPGGCTDGSGVPLTTDQRGVARPQGPACDIGSFEANLCANVVCTPTACHSAICNPETGECESTPLDDGTSCEDGNACTTNDACSGGTCVGGAAPNCDDGNACTDDDCDPASGCTHNNNTDSCSDGNTCTTADACSNGSCAGGTPLNCNDNNACTNDSCDPILGCQHASACDDHNRCTTDSCEVKKNGSVMCKHKKIKGCQ